MTVTTTARPSATGAPAYTATFTCAPISARSARVLTANALGAWRLDDLKDTVDLIASELIANACQHTRSRSIRTTITRIADSTVRVGVVDFSRTLPQPRDAMDADERGRGLAVIASLADRWGADPLPWGKRVWAEVSMSMSDAQPRPQDTHSCHCATR
ncbi:ATP-binding protein [Streptomyces sp. KR80]|uniref:ATP-binding protein n=1 Tax=Streptomyces sp. KR80 TaxID=3457426 RepID=UPI003FD3B59D